MDHFRVRRVGTPPGAISFYAHRARGQGMEPEQYDVEMHAHDECPNVICLTSHSHTPDMPVCVYGSRVDGKVFWKGQARDAIYFMWNSTGPAGAGVNACPQARVWVRRDGSDLLDVGTFNSVTSSSHEGIDFSSPVDDATAESVSSSSAVVESVGSRYDQAIAFEYLRDMISTAEAYKDRDFIARRVEASRDPSSGGGLVFSVEGERGGFCVSEETLYRFAALGGPHSAERVTLAQEVVWSEGQTSVGSDALFNNIRDLDENYLAVEVSQDSPAPEIPAKFLVGAAAGMSMGQVVGDFRTIGRGAIALVTGEDVAPYGYDTETVHCLSGSLPLDVVEGRMCQASSTIDADSEIIRLWDQHEKKEVEKEILQTIGEVDIIKQNLKTTKTRPEIESKYVLAAELMSGRIPSPEEILEESRRAYYIGKEDGRRPVLILDRVMVMLARWDTPASPPEGWTSDEIREFVIQHDLSALVDTGDLSGPGFDLVGSLSVLDSQGPEWSDLANSIRKELGSTGAQLRQRFDMCHGSICNATLAVADGPRVTLPHRLFPHRVAGFTGSSSDLDPYVVLTKFLVRDMVTGRYHVTPPQCLYNMKPWCRNKGQSGCVDNLGVAWGNRDISLGRMRSLGTRIEFDIGGTTVQISKLITFGERLSTFGSISQSSSFFALQAKKDPETTDSISLKIGETVTISVPLPFMIGLDVLLFLHKRDSDRGLILTKDGIEAPIVTVVTSSRRLVLQVEATKP
ncbi:unnamed protein product [Amoebophrya sp. A25]|nr:unnamed protein product [Amoebophrya sp. A25]|eukprot:GSA25T00013265001.1